MVIGSLTYILLVGLSILIGYVFIKNPAFNKGYYIEDYLDAFKTNPHKLPVTLPELTLHHIANLIMVIPILLKIMYLLYLNIVGRTIRSITNVQFKDM